MFDIYLLIEQTKDGSLIYLIFAK